MTDREATAYLGDITVGASAFDETSSEPRCGTEVIPSIYSLLKQSGATSTRRGKLKPDMIHTWSLPRCLFMFVRMQLLHKQADQPSLLSMVSLGLPAGKLLDVGHFKVMTVIESTIYVFPIINSSLYQGLAVGLWARLVNGYCDTWWVGFAWDVRASAFVCLGLLLVANVRMTANPPKTRKPDPPKLCALLTDSAYIGVLGLGSLLPFVLIFGLFSVDESVAALVIFASFYGFFSGGLSWSAVVSLSAPVVTSLVKDESEIVIMGSECSIRLGLAYFVASLGILAGNPIAGALLGETFSWWWPIMFGAIMLLVVVVLKLIARAIRACQIKILVDMNVG
ncbi:hypothetical protein J3R30DRAFT_3399980 [Lentinula aciculospora]|uniref:MFS general substrate transporter n=1 Tax=Lentinula aciculospora TaxID=153920 RepID=A0A9W9AUA2_9AGAR|nr:hypothetical protein J3R30DRAFT_3399980 [Lentinula aciculospora]